MGRRAIFVAAAAAAFIAGALLLVPRQVSTPPRVLASPFELPVPPGPYGVGRSFECWQRSETGSELPRRLPVYFYYPALARGREPVLPAGKAELNYGPLARRFGAAAASAFSPAMGSALSGAPIAADGQFPLVLFAPGASQLPTDYSVLIEALASSGYMVAAVSPNDAGPCAGPGIKSGAADYEKVALDLLALLDRMSAADRHPFAGRVDTGKVATLGHSLGGAAAVLAAARDPHILAAINLDGDFSGAAAEARPIQPILYLTSDPQERGGLSRLFGSAAKDEARRANLWQQISSKSQQAVSMRIRGSRHLTFTDIALASPQSIAQENREMRLGDIPGQRALALNNDLVRGFLEQHLRGKADSMRAALNEREIAPFPAGNP